MSSLDIKVLKPTITIFVWELVLNAQIRLHLVVCNLLQIKNMHFERKEGLFPDFVCFHFQSFCYFFNLLFLNRCFRSTFLPLDLGMGE